MKPVLLLSLALGVSASEPVLAGYTPATNIIPHSMIDLDQQEINNAVKSDGINPVTFEQAWFVYTNGGGGLCTQGDIDTASCLPEDEMAMCSKDGKQGCDSCCYKTTADAKGNSVKGSGSIRTLQGFATSGNKMASETFYKLYKNYWKDEVYADTFVKSAYEDAAMDDKMKSELMKKGTAYQTNWMYVLHEFEDAISDCLAGDIFANDQTPSGDAPHAWDEGWAFFAGSLEGETGGLTGVQLWNVAQKRCKDFGTCDNTIDNANNVATANSKALDLVKKGADKIALKKCNDVETEFKLIVDQMSVPLMQGMIKYAFKSDAANDLGSCKEGCPKEWAEGWAFAAAILPRINYCDQDVAAMIVENLDVANASPMSTKGYAAFKTEVEKTYSCLGLTCADIGALQNSVGVFPGMEACKDTDAAIAGYKPLTDVVPHSMIDLDQKEINSAAGSGSTDPAGWTDAMRIYAEGGGGFCTEADIAGAQCLAEADMKLCAKEGNPPCSSCCYGTAGVSPKGNSVKGSGSIRTLKGFATSGKAKMSNEEFWPIYSAYWGDDNYADTFVQSAYDDANMSPTMKNELIKKGTAYQTNWMYVIHEFEDAISDCEAGDIFANDLTATGSAPHAWDEGWAFYAGSLEGEDGTKGDGVLQYNLANKRGGRMATTVAGASGTATANVRALAAAKTGRDLIANEQCEEAKASMASIKKEMLLPLVQGLVEYAYKADPKSDYECKYASDASIACLKEWGEGWSFAAGALPLIDQCDSKVAEMVVANLGVTSTFGPITAGKMTPKTLAGEQVKDGFVAVKEQVETVYGCLGLTCREVGEWTNDGAVPVGMEMCKGSGGGGEPQPGKKKTTKKTEIDEVPIIIVCVIAAVLLLLSLCMFMKWRATEARLNELQVAKGGTMA